MVLHITCDEVVAHGGSASLNNAQGQTTKKLLAYTTYTTQPKITKKRIKLRKSKKKAPSPTNLLHLPFFQIFCHIQIFYFLFFIFSRMWNFSIFYPFRAQAHKAKSSSFSPWKTGRFEGYE